MTGAFGGLLSLLQEFGLATQLMLRRLLWTLIGEPAKKWNLLTLTPEHTEYREQRATRLVVGTAATAILIVIIGVAVGSGNIALALCLALVVLVAAAAGIRAYLESHETEP